MRTFSYEKAYEKLLTPEIVALLSQIHEYRGRQGTTMNAKPEVLRQLMDIARVQSTEASNEIEGIRTSDERMKKLMQQSTMPETRDEQKIAGYRDVFATVHENYSYIPVKPSMILQLHRDLYKFSGKAIGGSYKNADSIIAEEDAGGNKRVRFVPTPAWETAEAMDALCGAYGKALENATTDPLLLLPMFVLDFLCIHPFNEGNGRMSRLITLLLLCRSGYAVGKYISIERLIADSKENYYEALAQSSVRWHENENDYVPFASYLLGVVLAAYRELDRRIGIIDAGDSKIDQVRSVMREKPGRMTKAELLEACPGVSRVTVQRALAEMLKNGEILKIGGGRYTAYTWNREND